MNCKFTLPFRAFYKCLGLLLLFQVGHSLTVVAQEDATGITITGQVIDQTTGESLIGVSVVARGVSAAGTATDADGRYTIKAGANDSLALSYIGFKTLVIPVNNRNTIDVEMGEDAQSLEEIVVTGYGTQKRESVTGSISTINSDQIGRVKNSGTSASTGLAGKLAGVSFRQRDGRPGTGAIIQIRNMGEPLYVIDGVQQDGFQFNRLAPSDIESISILKDGAAAVYGIRAANGVVLVTTKRGNRGERSSVNLDASYGFQNWVNFPSVTNSSYVWAREKVQADINGFGTTNITPDELERYRIGTEPGYQSFDWKNFILQKNSPLVQVNLNTSGGSDRINYYAAVNRNYSNSVLGDEFDYGRTNIISNIDVNITDDLTVGVGINAYSEKTENPGIPGGDDYWLPRYAIMRNKPWQRPYANDNPEYINDIGHNETNWAYNNFANGGYLRDTRKNALLNGKFEYKIPFVPGLKVQGMASYRAEERREDIHEYTYDTYTYFPETSEGPEEYRRTGGSTNPYRSRVNTKVQEVNTQIGLSYSKIFGNHEVGALLLNERFEQDFGETFMRSQPQTNTLPLIYFNDIDRWNDYQTEIARLGYVGRLNYNFNNKYYVEVSGRRDASWRFAPDRRVGYFPGGSIGWRITQEPFIQNLLGESKVLSDLKLRASYAIVGDDTSIGAFAYLEGYTYNQGTAILNGRPIVGTSDRGQPIDNITWFTSKIFNVGADYSLFGGKITGAIDVFNRKRDGLRGRKQDVLIPSELGYGLPDENVSSDRNYGIDGLIAYNGQVNNLRFSVAANASFARGQFLNSYNPLFFNSWDQYRASGENRYYGVTWGYQVIGQFQSQEQINNYEVNVDGQGNRTLLPGDLIYKDVNGDQKIDGFDERPIGYSTDQPLINGGLSITVDWKGFDLAMDFSLASGYSFTAENELSRAFRAAGGNIQEHLLDAWHREDPFDINSAWVPGYFPPNRFDQGDLSSVNKRSDFWLENVTAFRGRTFQLGYSLPQAITQRIGMQRFRVYFNGFNLFSIHNVKRYNIDPEVGDTNGLQYPQSRVVSGGVNLTF